MRNSAVGISEAKNNVLSQLVALQFYDRCRNHINNLDIKILGIYHLAGRFEGEL
jgi:hypothetical protein